MTGIGSRVADGAWLTERRIAHYPLLFVLSTGIAAAQQRRRQKPVLAGEK